MFYNLESVLKRFVDVDHLLSLCVQIPKHESVRTAENRISQVCFIVHRLKQVHVYTYICCCSAEYT